MISPPSTPCSGSDVNYCLKHCCLQDVEDVLTHACACCHFLCCQKSTPPTVTQTCHQFCQLDPQNEVFQNEITNSSSINDNRNVDVGGRNLEIVVPILAVAVVVLAMSTVFLGVCWCRSRRRRRRRQKRGVGWDGKKRPCVQSVVSELPGGGVREFSQTGCSCGEKIGSEWSSREKTLQKIQQQQHPVDVDAGSLCETLSEDEFYDAWSTSPSSPRFEAFYT